MVFQKANPFPMSIYDNIAYGPRVHGIKAKSKLDEIVESSLRSAALWDEVKDRLEKIRWVCPGLDSSSSLCIARALACRARYYSKDEPHPLWIQFLL